MCEEKDDQCKKPEEPVEKPEECTPEQTSECHGDAKEHPCCTEGDKQ